MIIGSGALLAFTKDIVGVINPFTAKAYAPVGVYPDMFCGTDNDVGTLKNTTEKLYCDSSTLSTSAYVPGLISTPLPFPRLMFAPVDAFIIIDPFCTTGNTVRFCAIVVVLCDVVFVVVVVFDVVVLVVVVVFLVVFLEDCLERTSMESSAGAEDGSSPVATIDAVYFPGVADEDADTVSVPEYVGSA